MLTQGTATLSEQWDAQIKSVGVICADTRHCDIGQVPKFHRRVVGVICADPRQCDYIV